MTPRTRQIAWFVGLWCGGVLAVGIVGLIIRWFLLPE